MSSSLPTNFLAIDEEGYALNGEIRITDRNVGREILANIKVAQNGAFVSTFGEAPVIIEAFDEPLIALRVERDEGSLFYLLFPYDFDDTCNPETFWLDEWDRFHGKTSRGIPFVFSRSAQAGFFDLLEEFDDESITVGEETFEIPMAEGKSAANVEEAEPSAALVDMFARLRLRKCRILVAGSVKDADLLRGEGHVVTFLDQKQDPMLLEPSMQGAFDIVYLKNPFAGLAMNKRKNLVKQWQRWLVPGGHLMAVFFLDQTSEWELRERLKKNFRFLFWGRWQKSSEARQGRELFIYAQKLDSP